jgi:glycosyltransferase involved in cell wall biosynthesis
MNSLYGKKTRLVVDFTPILPGAENGGAKPLSIALIRSIAQLAPEWDLILLTHERSHEELKRLEKDCKNIQCVCVVSNFSTGPNQTAGWVKKMRVWVMDYLRTHLPADLKVRLKNLLLSQREIMGRSSLIRDLEANLLFCPFTATYYADPHIPTVAVVNDLQYLAYPEFFDPDDCAERDRAFRSACRSAIYIVTGTEFVRSTVINAGNLPEEKVLTILDSLLTEANYQEPKATGILERLGLKERNYFIFPANFWMHKNHAMLLVALGQFQAAQPNLPLKVVFTGAPGPKMDRIREAATQMKLDEKVIFAGFVLQEEYLDLLGHARALVFPSLFEGFGIPVLEAMAAGVPVCCSDATCLPEVGGDAVLYFDPRKPQEIAAAMDRLLKDDALCTDLVERGRRRFSEIGDAKRMASQYISVFNKALTAKGANYSNHILGVYPDGWTADRVEVFYAPTENSSESVLITELEMMPWFKYTVRLEVSLNDQEKIWERRAKPGEKVIREFNLPSGGGFLTIRISPSFVPSELKMGDDHRRLGVQIRKCLLKTAQSEKDFLKDGME